EGGAADDLEHVGGSGLLLQRFTQLARACLHLIEQPHVLNRDYRLIGEGGHQLDLLVVEWLNFGLQNGDDTAKNSFAEHRNCQYGAVTLLFDQLGKFIVRLLQHVPDMNRTSLKRSFPRHRAWSWAQRMSI